MQSLHYNNGSIKLTRERSTMVSRWEADEVARWVSGLAGIQSDVSDLFFKHQITGAALSLLIRDDLIRMGIQKLDQQIILMQSIDLLLTLVDRLNSETLALLIMRIHSAANTSWNFFKRNDEKDGDTENSNWIKSPSFYTSISHLSDAIVITCHWLGRLPFIENAEYIALRRKIIKSLVQIRVLLKNVRMLDQINLIKPKLKMELDDLRTTTIGLIRRNKDSLFSSDRYLIRVHLRRPLKNDVNIEYSTLPDFTHVISSIETEAMGFMGSGFNAINVGDEIIEINNQVVIGWDPVHFEKLIRDSSNPNEICLLVKKMPRHKDDEVYTQCLSEGPYNRRRSRIRGVLERKQQQARDNRTRLIEQQGLIEIESDDEVLYQSKRSSQRRPDQHSSLPDLSAAIPPTTPTYPERTIPTTVESQTSVSTIASDFSRSPMSAEVKSNPMQNIERQPSLTGSYTSLSTTPRSPKKSALESYIPTFFRSRQDPKSIIPASGETPSKDHPQLVHVRRIPSIHKHSSSTQDERPPVTSPSFSKSTSQTKTLSPTGFPLSSSSSARSSFSNLFKSSDSSDKHRMKQMQSDQGKIVSVPKSERSSLVSSQSSLVTNKPPLNDSRENFHGLPRRARTKRTPSYRRISCKDLGKGDCEGSLYRYMPKGTLSLVSWKLLWCVLKGGILYVFKSKDDVNQEIEIKLEGKNISPAPEKRKYAFRIVDETNRDREYFSCANRDEMAKWMNKMGLAAINFNINDSKIAGFHKGFLDSREASPASTSRTLTHSSTTSQLIRHIPITSLGDSENDSDKESFVSWQPSFSQASSIFDMDLVKEKNRPLDEKPTGSRHVRSSSAASVASLPERNQCESTNPPKYPLRNLTGNPPTKGHHRTCSSPIRFIPTYVEQPTNNIYLNAAASKLTDSDSSTDHSPQRSFVKSDVLNSNSNDRAKDRFVSVLQNYPNLALNASGGFTTPTAPLSPSSSERTASLSPSALISSSPRPSNNSVFLADDDDFLSSSSRSGGLHRPHSSSSSSSQLYSPGINRASPLYIPNSASASNAPSIKPSKTRENQQGIFFPASIDADAQPNQHVITSPMQTVEQEDEENLSFCTF